MPVMITLAYAIVSVIQIRSMSQRKLWRDLAAFCIFMGTSYIVSLLLSLGIKLPNPVDALHDFFEIIGLHY